MRKTEYVREKNRQKLGEEDGRGDSGDGGPVAEGLDHASHAKACGAVLLGDGGAVGEGSVDEDGDVSLVLGDGDDGLVEGFPAAVANELVVVGCIVVVIATADLIPAATADDVADLILVARVVVEVVLVGVGVHVGTVQPDAWPEGEGAADQDEGQDAGGAWSSGLVGGDGTAGVVSTAGEVGLGAGAASGATAYIRSSGAASEGLVRWWRINIWMCRGELTIRRCS